MTELTTEKKEFTITRTFDAPRSVIWRAWTDEGEAAVWWHPREVTTPRESVKIDARTGGRYEYLMITADGEEYPTAGEYLEVVDQERLVFTWAEPGDSVEGAPVITVELTDAPDGRTEMTFTLVGIEAQPGDDNVYDGWSEAFDVLVEHLA
jgi:uncharacterized protein YndB with AHSA1/START domain